MNMHNVHVVGNFIVAVMVVCGLALMLCILAIELVSRIVHYVQDRWYL
jgi:hypothetical protein